MDRGGGDKNPIIDETTKLGMSCTTARGRRQECPVAGPGDGEVDNAD
jgi:hypothetical protein